MLERHAPLLREERSLVIAAAEQTQVNFNRWRSRGPYVPIAITIERPSNRNPNHLGLGWGHFHKQKYGGRVLPMRIPKRSFAGAQHLGTLFSHAPDLTDCDKGVVAGYEWRLRNLRAIWRSINERQRKIDRLRTTWTDVLIRALDIDAEYELSLARAAEGINSFDETEDRLPF